MEHWTKTAELKESSRIHRRANNKALADEGIESYASEAKESCEDKSPA